MKITVSVRIQAGDDAPAEIKVFALERGALAPGTVGLRLDEAKDLLAAVQEKVVAGQAGAALTTRRRTVRAAGQRTGIRMPATSCCGPCSVPCAFPVPAGGGARARRGDAHLQSAGRLAARPGDPGAFLPGGQVRQPGLLRDLGQAAGRDPPPRTPAALPAFLHAHQGSSGNWTFERCWRVRCYFLFL